MLRCVSRDEKVGGRTGGLSRSAAFRRVSEGLGSTEAGTRRAAAVELTEVTEHFLATAEFGAVWKVAWPLVAQTLAGQPADAEVLASALAAAAALAHHAWFHGRHDELEQALVPLLAYGAEPRETAALEYELALVRGDQARADRAWARGVQTDDQTTAPRARHLFERVTWDDRRALHLTLAARHGAPGREVLLDEAIALIEPRLERDLVEAGYGDGRGFVWETYLERGLAAEAVGDRPAMKTHLARAQHVYQTLVSRMLPSILEDALRRAEHEPVAPGSAAAQVAALLDFLVEREAIALEPGADLTSLGRSLGGVTTASAIVTALMKSPAVAEVFADDDELAAMISAWTDD